MRRIIPRELVKHLEWVPGQEVPRPPEPHPVSNSSAFDVERILNGQTFYSEKKDSSGRSVGVADALKQAMDYATPEGIIVSMPELIAVKVKAEKEHAFWKKGYDVHTEENIGLDKKGIFGERDKPVLVVVHGGGILTPDRIEQAYSEGLINGSAKYTEKEFSELLEGKLPNGKTLPVHSLDELKHGISGLQRQYGVVMPYELAQSTKSDYHLKNEFVENPLVIARAGGTDNLEAYFDKAKHQDNNNLGNWHPFAGRTPSVPQGRLLFLNSSNDGLGGNLNLNNIGRFVGVAPEAPGARE